MTAKNKTKIVIKNDGFEGFIRRGREHAKALDKGETLPSEITISFETPTEMMRVFTVKRTELLEKLTQDGQQPISQLATKLKRKRTAVTRDSGMNLHGAWAQPTGKITKIRGLHSRWP